MTQDCSLSSSAAGENPGLQDRRFPKGIHIVGTGEEPVSRTEGLSPCGGEQERSPWGYILVHHMSAEAFGRRMDILRRDGVATPRFFVHRSYVYKPREDGRGVRRELRPSVSGMVFLQGATGRLRSFLLANIPQYRLVNDCSTGLPASIADSVMRPFMRVLETSPERVTFLRAPFARFARDHVRLRVLTGAFRGQEGYIVRIDRDRQLVMDIGGYAVAIRGVHNEDFEVAEK